VDVLANRVKRYGSALREVVTLMPSDTPGIPQHFGSIEAMICSFEVPKTVLGFIRHS